MHRQIESLIMLSNYNWDYDLKFFLILCGHVLGPKSRASENEKKRGFIVRKGLTACVFLFALSLGVAPQRCPLRFGRTSSMSFVFQCKGTAFF